MKDYFSESYRLGMPINAGPPCPLSAGEWFRLRPRSWDPRPRWHLFAGDLSCRPGWLNVHARTACGITVEWSPRDLERADDPASDRCLRCERVKPTP